MVIVDVVVSPQQVRLKLVEASAEETPGRHDPSLNPRNTFTNFVVGNSNLFASAAAQAVAAAPGRTYNPLYLFGGPGLGKTHLLHAIGHYVLAQQKRARLVCVSGEEFSNEYLHSIQTDQQALFHKHYREADLLLVDDLQFLAGKDSLEEEFFHTFNALQQNQRQMVLTSDAPANEVPNLDRRLISRIEGGLVADLQPPDAEMRMTILERKAQSLGAKLPAEIMHLLANRAPANIGELEGALIRVASYSLLTHRELNTEVAEGLLRGTLLDENRPAPRIEAIQEKVAEHFNIPVAEMTNRRRMESVALPRQIAMYISRQLTGMSLSAIGEEFGGRDHATVLRACQSLKGLIDVDPKIRQTVSYLERHLGG